MVNAPPVLICSADNILKKNMWVVNPPPIPALEGEGVKGSVLPEWKGSDFEVKVPAYAWVGRDRGFTWLVYNSYTICNKFPLALF